MKILCTGSSGMLGREVYTAAVNASHQTIGLGRAELDITSRSSVSIVLRNHRPDVVINCAGLTKHRMPVPTEYEYDEVNAFAPPMLARACDSVGARLIHVSTDCVFSGERLIEDGPYTEDDEPDATDAYGVSKAFGEVTRAPHLTVRCSFVGIGERGLIAWLRTRGTWDPVDRWYNAHWSGSTAPAIARALVELAQGSQSGLMHLSGEHVTKGHLINLITSLGLAPDHVPTARMEPVLNRWLASNRDDVPALPPLHEALRELAR